MTAGTSGVPVWQRVIAALEARLPAEEFARCSRRYTARDVRGLVLLETSRMLEGKVDPSAPRGTPEGEIELSPADLEEVARRVLRRIEDTGW